jgi:hypothetical protein
MAKKINLDWSGLTDKLNQQNKGQSAPTKTDERFYQLKFAEDGTGQAVIRFLPAPTGLPIVKVYRHRFKGRGFFNANCPTTIGRDCPVCTANRELWDADPNTVKTRSRVQQFIANIVVVRDPLTPANQGKVFLYRFGKKIYEKVMNTVQPPKNGLEEVAPVIVFDYYEGANFKLLAKQKKVGDRMMPNFDESAFSAVSKLGTDVEIERIHKSLFELGEFVAEDQFKTFEELADRFARVTGTGGTPVPAHVGVGVGAGPIKAGAVAAEEEEPDSKSDDDFVAELRASATPK